MLFPSSSSSPSSFLPSLHSSPFFLTLTLTHTNYYPPHTLNPSLPLLPSTHPLQSTSCSTLHSPFSTLSLFHSFTPIPTIPTTAPGLPITLFLLSSLALLRHISFSHLSFTPLPSQHHHHHSSSTHSWAESRFLACQAHSPLSLSLNPILPTPSRFHMGKPTHIFSHTYTSS